MSMFTRTYGHTVADILLFVNAIRKRESKLRELLTPYGRYTIAQAVCTFDTVFLQYAFLYVRNKITSPTMW